MANIVLQSEENKRQGIHYECDPNAQPLGEGGMGKVYKGIRVDEKNGAVRPVAIKFMYSDLPEQSLKRAKREAMVRLRNDNLVEMLDFIEIQERAATGEITKRCHVVSELLTGVSLSDVLDGKTKGQDGEDIPFAVKMVQDYQNDPERFAQIIVTNVLSGLMALHDAGYIHRDIDPSNIMLTSDGHIKLIDFGIAKQMNTLTTSDKSLTVAGKFMGKPEYAAPELVLGDIAHQNQTTDIYAVGILLFQCILGHTPFEGSRYEVLEMQLKAKLPLNKVKNKQLRNIIASACQKKQELRYQSSAQMRVALESINGIKPKMSANKIIGLGAVCIAVIVVLILTINTILSQKEEAQKLVDEQTEMFQAEKIKAELSDSIKSIIQEADNELTKGLNREDEDAFEKHIIKAIDLYTAAEQLISRNPECGYSTDELTKKKQKGIQAIDAACSEISEQASDLVKYGEKELAKTYDSRVKAMVEYKKTIKQ